MTTIPFPRLVAATCLGLTLTAGVACDAFGQENADDAIPAARLLPPETVAFLTVPDVPQLKARFNETLLGQLREEPELAPFWKEVEAAFREFSTEAEKELGVKLDDLWELPQGDLSIAIVAPRDQKFGFVLMLDYGRAEDTIDTLLETAADKLAEEGAERTTSEVDDTQLVIHTIPPNEEDENSKEQTVAWFLRDSYLVIATETYLLETVLDRWSGDHPKTFAEHEVHTHIQKQCAPDGSESVVRWFVDPVGLVNAAVRASDDVDFQTQMALSFLDPLGVNGIRGLGGAIDLATEEYDTVSRIMIYVEQPPKGLLKVVRMPAVQQAPPRWISTEVPNYLQLNLDVPGAYAAVEELVDSFQGEGALARILDDAAENPDGPGIHPKKDLIDLLDGQIHVVNVPPESDDLTAGTPTARFFIAFGIKDADKVRALMGKLVETPGANGKVRQFQGENIYEFSPGGEDLVIALSVAQGHLFMTSEVRMVENVLRGDAGRKPLAEAPDYRRIAEHFPSKTSMIGYQGNQSQMKAIYELLRSGQLDEQIEAIDFTKLPKFDVIEKYLPPSGAYAIPDEHGAVYVTFTRRKSVE